LEYTIDLLMLLEEKERPTRTWWQQRYAAAITRAGGLPQEIPDLLPIKPARVTDPDSGDRFAKVTLPLAAGTGQPRAAELAHMLLSVFDAEGYTLRADGQRIEIIPGLGEAPPAGELGAVSYTGARVCSSACLNCCLSTDTRVGCCGQGSAFSLADIGASLMAGEEQMVADCLALPGRMDGVKWHPYLKGGICVYHSPDRGCTLPPTRMPLQCRIYLCMPERLLPPAAQAGYAGYVDALEEAEAFIEDHMRLESGVDFGSPLDALKTAAEKAFAAWEAGEKA
jgi:hypothetical protein